MPSEVVTKGIPASSRGVGRGRAQSPRPLIRSTTQQSPLSTKRIRRVTLANCDAGLLPSGRRKTSQSPVATLGVAAPFARLRERATCSQHTPPWTRTESLALLRPDACFLIYRPSRRTTPSATKRSCRRQRRALTQPTTRTRLARCGRRFRKSHVAIVSRHLRIAPAARPERPRLAVPIALPNHARLSHKGGAVRPG